MAARKTKKILRRSSSAGSGWRAKSSHSGQATKTIKKTKTKKMKGPKPIGKVTHWFGKIDVAIVKLATPFKVGDYIEFKGHEVDFVQKIDSMQINHKFVERAAKGKEIGIKVIQKVKEGALVYKATAQTKVAAIPASSKALPVVKPKALPAASTSQKAGYKGTKFLSF